MSRAMQSQQEEVKVSQPSLRATKLPSKKRKRMAGVVVAVTKGEIESSEVVHESKRQKVSDEGESSTHVESGRKPSAPGDGAKPALSGEGNSAISSLALYGSDSE